MKTRYHSIRLLSVLVVLILIGCSNEPEKNAQGRDRLVPAVEAVQASFGSLPLVERLSGVVKATNQVEIYAEISAVIMAVHVQNGDEVRQGDPLIQLRDREFQERLNHARAAYQIAQAQARQARARLAEINSELKRSQTLAEQEMINQAELEAIETRALAAEADVDLAEARVEQALANVAEQEEMLAQTLIRAPVDGTIGNRNAEIGMMVGPGTRLLTMGQLDSVRVEVVLTDRMLNYIEQGQRTEIRASTLPEGGVLTAKLSRISPFLHPVAHSTEAEIDLPNPGHHLKSGMFVTTDIYYGESEQATLVPLSALYDNPLTGATGVYISRDTANKIPDDPVVTREQGNLTEPVAFEFVPVEVLAKGRMSAGIRGIDPEEWVVTLGQDLFGGESGLARVRAVDWSYVESLQQLQREDLLQEIMRHEQAVGSDTASSGSI